MKDNNKDISKEKQSLNRFWPFVRKNGSTILMVIVFVILIVSPDAKSFVIQQIMKTGFFNASIDKKDTDISNLTSTDFNFMNEQKIVQNTSSLRGKVVFINFWASWCPPCRAEFPSIETLYSKFKNNPDIFFLTINEDSDYTKAKTYLEKENFSVPFYITNGNVPVEIYSGALPTTIVLDKNGKIRFHTTGFANYASDKFIKQIDNLIQE